MGAAKKRGTFEQRKSEAIKRNQNKPLQKSKPIKSSSILPLLVASSLMGYGMENIKKNRDCSLPLVG